MLDDDINLLVLAHGCDFTVRCLMSCLMLPVSSWQCQIHTDNWLSPFPSIPHIVRCRYGVAFFIDHTQSEPGLKFIGHELNDCRDQGCRPYVGSRFAMPWWRIYCATGLSWLVLEIPNSTQKRRPPSGFLTKRTSDEFSVLLGVMNPLGSISSIYFSTAESSLRDMLYGRLKGSLAPGLSSTLKYLGILRPGFRRGFSRCWLDDKRG